MSLEEGFEWIDAIHAAVMESDTIEDFDGLQLWWYETVVGIGEELKLDMKGCEGK